jgi:hypothetical protein
MYTRLLCVYDFAPKFQANQELKQDDRLGKVVKTSSRGLL